MLLWKKALIFCFCLSLSACVGSVMKSHMFSLDDVLEDTTDKLLVLNILRARDKAPLHFSDISDFHTSITETAGLSIGREFDYFPGSLNGANAGTGRKFTNVPSFSYSISPTMNVTHLDTKDFVTGIASPIEPRFVKYWLDRGLDRRIVLLTFFSEVSILRKDFHGGPTRSISILNAPREATEHIRRRKGLSDDDLLRCDGLSEFERFLKLINSISTFFANSYTERRPLVSNLKLQSFETKDLQALAALDPAKFLVTLDDDKTRTYSVRGLSSEQKIALCFYNDLTRESCFRSVIDQAVPTASLTGADDSHAQPVLFPGIKDPDEIKAPSDYCAIYNDFLKGDYKNEVRELNLTLRIRSVGEIIQFLGDLLHYQDELSRLRSQLHLERLHSPITFGYCPPGKAGCSDQGFCSQDAERRQPLCNDVFFTLDSGRCGARFELSYRGKDYAVGNFDPPDPDSDGGCKATAGANSHDHTLEILSVVHQLIDLNRSAADIRTTPFVQVLP